MSGPFASVSTHNSNTGLLNDDHTQYVHNTTARTITAQHTFNPANAGAPFVLGANATGQLVTGLNAAQLGGQTWAAPGIIGSATPAAATFGNLVFDSDAPSDWTLRTGYNTFLGHIDHVMCFGFNVDGFGSPINTADYEWALVWERDYWTGATAHQAEFYLQYVSIGGGTIYRPFEVYMHHDTLTADIVLRGTVYIGPTNTPLYESPSGTLTTTGELHAHSLVTDGLILYYPGGVSPSRYEMGIGTGGTGEFTFQSKDTITPRSLIIVSSGGLQKWSCGFDTGTTSQTGTISSTSTGTNALSGYLTVGTVAVSGTARIEAWANAATAGNVLAAGLYHSNNSAQGVGLEMGWRGSTATFNSRIWSYSNAGAAYGSQLGLYTHKATATEDDFNLILYGDSAGNVGIGDNAPGEKLDVAGNTNVTGVYKVDDVQVVSNRVVDARADDTINTSTWDSTTAGVLDAVRDALITHGLIAAA